jgi:hypothetical protein
MTDKVERAEAALVHYRELRGYLISCVNMRDWHGVRDAAVDIEVLEAEYPELRERPLT